MDAVQVTQRPPESVRRAACGEQPSGASFQSEPAAAGRWGQANNALDHVQISDKIAFYFMKTLRVGFDTATGCVVVANSARVKHDACGDAKCCV